MGRDHEDRSQAIDVLNALRSLQDGTQALSPLLDLIQDALRVARARGGAQALRDARRELARFTRGSDVDHLAFEAACDELHERAELLDPDGSAG